MPAKKPTRKVRRPAKAEKKAPKKPKAEGLEGQVARIGKQVETLLNRKAVSLADAQGEILEKLPQMIEGLSGQLEQIGKAAKSKELLRLENANRELLGTLQSDVHSLHEEVNTLRQTLEGIKSSVEQAVSKPSPPAAEEQQTQTEEPKVG